MNALIYLVGTRLKNQLKSLIKKPLQLLYFVVILAVLGMNLIGGKSAGAAEGRVLRPQGELTALVTLLYTVMFLLTVKNGFDRGGSLFTMADVNLLFVSPFRPQRLLFYGLFRQMSSSLLVGFFLLFQYATLHGNYGVSYGQLILLLLGYAAAIFLGQVTAVVLYAFTSADEYRKRLCKTVFYFIIAAFVAAVGMRCLPGERSGLLPRAVSAVNSLGALFPASGWLGMAFGGVLAGSFRQISLGVGLSTAYFAVLVAMILFNDPDYYEDVLGSAEAAHSAITAKKEGKLGETAPRNVRVGKTGLGGGWGAQAFYFKHRLENRRSRLFLLSSTNLLFAAMAIGFSLLMRESGIYAVFSFATYMQIFSIMLGRLNRELMKPYIYLVPEPPMKRLLWCLAEMLPSSLTEAVVIFVPVGIILRLNPLDIVLCVAARLVFALLITSGNVVLERLWGGVTSRVLVVFLYFIIIAVLAAPGVLLASLLSAPLGGSITAFFLVLSVGNLLVSLLALFLCRNMLEYAEYNNT